MPTNPFTGQFTDSVGAEIFRRLERLEAEISVLRDVIGQIQNTRMTTPLWPSGGRRSPDVRPMSITEFKAMFGHDPIPVSTAEAKPTVIEEPKQADPHPATQTSFVLKI